MSDQYGYANMTRTERDGDYLDRIPTNDGGMLQRVIVWELAPECKADLIASLGQIFGQARRALLLEFIAYIAARGTATTLLDHHFVNEFLAQKEPK